MLIYLLIGELLHTTLNWTDDQLHNKPSELHTYAYSIRIGYTLYPMENIMGKVAQFLGCLRISTFNQLYFSPKKSALKVCLK